MYNNTHGTDPEVRWFWVEANFTSYAFLIVLVIEKKAERVTKSVRE